ncbi:MAG: hypothetical protein ABSH28_04630 [Acidobacteriota bacterium]
MRQIEKPAEAAELEIWRELQRSTALKMRVSTAKRNDAGLGVFTLPNSLP